ncbi:hypothetical protein BGW38_010485 [Lunasporangiospora selenospora]|uniref:Uncharacterized protein n=1 Tax=Lunasporangiospora selenospora TaxID=979761 RepID=A0A9P6FYD9_9FUNG|nr:hypothetical protein BGW38_010485 [Lunasporangiospora selenospora]
MATSQQLRCSSRTVPRSEAIIEARFDKMTKKNVIRWGSVAQAFPGAIYVLKGDRMVEFDCDSDMEELVPRRIAAYSDEVLEVVVADQGFSSIAQSQSDHTDTQTHDFSGPHWSTAINTLSDSTQQVNHPATIEASQLNQDPNSIDANRKTTEPHKTTQSLTGSLPHTASSDSRPGVNNQAHQVNKVDDIRSLQSTHIDTIPMGSYLHDELSAKQKEILERKAQISPFQDRIAELHDGISTIKNENKKMRPEARSGAIQDRLQTVITKNYELLENPIPRLFIILPQDPHFKGWFNPFIVPFRLYFLCECGSHTMGELTTVHHKIHIANHEGYDVEQPAEFLKNYAPHLLVVLEMIKYGITTAETVAPALAMANISEQLKFASKNIQNFQEGLKDFVDDVISIFQSNMKSANYSGSANGQSEDSSVLEGADLERLKSYLSNSDTHQTLGNLYRMITNEGHVKWVCQNHYRVIYGSESRKHLQEVVESSGGDFNESDSKVVIDLRSKAAALRFYDALYEVRGVDDLSIRLSWDATYSDLRQLETAVKLCNVAIIRLEASVFNNPKSDVFNRGRRFDPLLGMMTNGRIQSFELVQCRDFFKRISRLPQNAWSSTLQSFGLHYCDLRTLSDAVNLFSVLPRVKHFQVEDLTLSITLQRIETLPNVTGSRALEIQVSIRQSLKNYWDHGFDDLFKMDIAHLKIDVGTFSECGLERILTRSQQLETLTIDTEHDTHFINIISDVNRVIRGRQHPLRLFNMINPSLNSTVSVNYDHGRIISGTLEGPQYGTIELDDKSNVALGVMLIEKDFFWVINGLRVNYRDDLGILSAFVCLFTVWRSEEIYCDSLGYYSAYFTASTYMSLSKDSLTKLTLGSCNLEWIRNVKGDEIGIKSFPCLKYFEFHFQEPAQNSPNTSPAIEDIEKLIDWLARMLPDKFSQQTHPQKMTVKLKNVDLEFGSWDRLLSSIDFQSLDKFKLTDCVFTKEMFLVLRMALVGADLDLNIENMKKVSLESKADFVASLQHSGVRINWAP